MDATVIRLRPDADQRIVTLDTGWSPVLPAQKTVASGSKKQITASLSKSSKFMSDFITDFPRADKMER